MSEHSAIELDYEALSDRGPVRSENQDAFLVWKGQDGSLALIVSDGMGGHASGREAAEMVVRLCARACRQRMPTDSWPKVLKTSLELAHQEVLAAQRMPDRQGMGATVAIAVLERNGEASWNLHIAHAGDSRVYLVRGKSLYRLTTDHSLVARMIEDGLVREEDAFDHPDSNVIQRAIGQQTTFEPELQAPALVESGDLLLVCSDGLHGSVPDERIQQIASSPQCAAETCHRLLAAAFEHHSTDNVTVACCRLPAARGRKRPTQIP